MIKYIIVIFVLAGGSDAEEHLPDIIPPQFRESIDHMSIQHLIKLTEYLVKDVTYKLRHADRVQEKHKHSITFELGSIAAAILDKFKHMIEVYRKLANDKAIRDDRFSPWDYLVAFHMLQGDYNEIRLEMSMFYGIVREFEGTRAITTKFKLPAHMTLPGMHHRRLWSVDPRTFDF